MTYAERTAEAETRDDEHMIYEMGPISQYEDGSVLNCVPMLTYTREEVVAGCLSLEGDFFGYPAKSIMRDLRRNATAAVKNGKTENRAPFAKE